MISVDALYGIIEDVPPSDRNKEQQYCPLIFIFYPNFIGRWIDIMKISEY
jgi:hypothetical protein